MDAGQVEVLVILGGNPVFSAPADLKFAERLGKVGLVAYHGLHVDETAHLAHWNLPAAHALESWGDARAFDGTVTLTQPLIAPLYEGRSAHEMLALFTTQADRRGMQIVKDYWTRRSRRRDGWTITHTGRRTVHERRRVLAARAARRLHPRHRGHRRRSGDSVRPRRRRASEVRRARRNGCRGQPVPSPGARQHRH